MTEIVTGDAFGVDRIDYLLRDSHHAGVAYGRFDHYRLIDTLRILPHPKTGQPMIGIQKGGIHAAEAPQLARQFMFLQLYYHHVRLAYDMHLSEFMLAWLKTYPTEIEEHLGLTDHDVLVAIANAARDSSFRGHDPASRIVNRTHFRKVYERHSMDQQVQPEAIRQLADALERRFGPEHVRDKVVPLKPQNLDFPVELDSGEISTSIAESTLYADAKPAAVGFVFVSPERREEAESWLKKNKQRILHEQLELDL